MQGAGRELNPGALFSRSGSRVCHAYPSLGDASVWWTASLLLRRRPPDTGGKEKAMFARALDVKQRMATVSSVQIPDNCRTNPEPTQTRRLHVGRWI
jgi:hypothetical protein